MLISGFTFVRNAEKYYFPIRESIESVLPVVDEFVVALGKSDEGDHTEEIIRSIGSDKIKIIYREWDEQLFKGGEIYRYETNFAKSVCKGDWCFYIQADEVVHEKYLDKIKAACKKYRDDKKVEGFLFKYCHFWGDYDHVLDFHGWYHREIRIVRNDPEIQSIGDAQSFRKKSGDKLNVILLPVEMYHYGWVRPPRLMRAKKKEQDTQYWGRKKAEEVYKNIEEVFSYGPLGKIPLFKGSHPAVMKSWIGGHDWKEMLDYGKQLRVNRALFKHEKTKYRLISWIENKLLGGRRIFAYGNWNIVGREK